MSRIYFSVYSGNVKFPQYAVSECDDHHSKVAAVIGAIERKNGYTSNGAVLTGYSSGKPVYAVTFTRGDYRAIAGRCEFALR